MTALEALKKLFGSLPKCCTCPDVAVVMNDDRWWMCEKCFISVPCSDVPPAVDMRGGVYAAMAVLTEEDEDFRS